MAIHKDLTGVEAIHPAAFVQTGDPGAVGPDKLWIEEGGGIYKLFRRNAADTGWQQVAPTLDNGLIDPAQLPAIGLVTVQTAANEAAQLALSTQEGDVVVRTDENKSYVRNSGTAGTMADFTLLLTPTDTVLSVFGRTGAVVALAGDYDETKGGTGQTAYAAGDLLYASAANTLSRLAKGTDGQRLKLVSGLPAWTDDVVGFSLTIGDGVNVIPTGIWDDFQLPFAGTLTSVRLLADATGSIVVDVWKQAYASLPPTVAQTITAAAKPTLSAALKYEDTSLTGWTKGFAAGDWYRINVDSAATVKRVVLAFQALRT